MKKTLDAEAMEEVIRENGYLFPKPISGNRTAAIMPLIFTHAIITMHNDDRAQTSYEDRWCYHNLLSAMIALAEWDGEGEPTGWHRHPDSGRRRDEHGNEYINP